MKVKLLMLLGMTVVPLLSVGQTTKPCLYNKGLMSVVGTGPDDAVLYVDGDFIVSRDATVKSQIYVDGSKTIITGDFIQDAAYIAGDAANAFTLPATYTDANASKISFQGTAAQKIKTRWGYNSYRKGVNYINFPDIEVVNINGVTITPEIAAKVQNVYLTTGKLVLDSRRVVAADSVYDGNGNVSQAGVHNAANSSLLAHLQVESGITYNALRETPGANLNEVGRIQVKLELDDPATTTDNPSEESPTVKLGKSLVGMGSPFDKISADYFMWNHLMFPYDNNIIGRLNYTETEPRTVIPAGKGFVVGIDLKGTDASKYHAASPWGNTSFASRATEGYTFDRFAYDNLNNLYPLAQHTNQNFSTILANGIATSNPTDATFKPYADENLVYRDVPVTLINGFNYLANPYMTPLDLSDLLEQGATDEWGVTRGDAATGFDIYNYVWILNPSARASASHNLNNGTEYGANEEKVYVNYSYLLMKKDGGTSGTYDDTGYLDGGGSYSTIAPLQMFLVYANNSRSASQITIPKSKRSISSGSVFLRSTSSAPAHTDDFLFEVVDKTSNVFDRAAVVIRTPEQIKANASYKSVAKLTTTVTDNTTKSTDFATLTESGSVSTGGVNTIIYTMDAATGTALESNFLSTAEGVVEKTTTLYLNPGKSTKDITVRGLRLNTMNRVSKIWLEDSKTNRKFDLSSGEAYEATVASTDATDRFTLRFVLGTSGIEDDVEVAQSLNSYYRDQVLTVTGFEDADFGSQISIYDIQGRLLKQQKVDQLTMNIPASFASGAYIVKVVGNKSHVSKFLVR